MYKRFLVWVYRRYLLWRIEGLNRFIKEEEAAILGHKAFIGLAQSSLEDFRKEVSRCECPAIVEPFGDARYL